MPVTQHAIVGSLLGTAIGDALGLPYEGLTPTRGRKLFGPPNRFHLLPNRGMVSDDTEQTCMVLQALVASAGNVDLFTKTLARQFRLWVLSLPAGTGRATLLASLKLCFGVSPRHSGVFSAGNGPAMRSPILGAAIDDSELLKQPVKSSTRITHSDPKAEFAALAVAWAARTASLHDLVDARAYLHELQRQLTDTSSAELLELISRAVDSVDQRETTESFACQLGLDRGVSGYAYHTVPVALHAWLSHPRDFRAAVTAVINAGGDTDTTAAIVGGIVGCTVGKAGLPAEWLSGYADWPRTIGWMEMLAGQFAESCEQGVAQKPHRLPAYGLLPRNLLFIAIVLAHGFRRLLPPW